MKKITFFHEHIIKKCLVSKTKLLYVLLFAISYSYAQISTNNIRAQYDFDAGTVLEDSSVGGNDFTQTGSALTEINDRFNNPPTSAVSLNGDYLTRTDISIVGSNPFSDAFDVSYSFWLKTNTNTNDIKTIIDDSTRDTAIGFDSNDVGYYIFYRDGKINLSSRFIVTNPGYNPSTIGYGHSHPTVISDGNWHHIVVQFSATESLTNSVFSSKIYIDEILDSQTITSAPITTSPNTSGNVTIGNSRFNHLALANRYTDVIDDILIYNRPFTAAEVTTLANDNNYCFTASSSLLSISAITNTTAIVNIASNSGDVYDIAYHKSSESFSNATFISGITSTTANSLANLTGLDIFTDYDVYLKKQCVNSTNWSNSVTFTTTQPNPRIYVDNSATGNNDGSSWADAYTNLYDALNGAIQNYDVWISKGTYKPHASDRDRSFIVKNNVYGGFEGTEVNFSDRDVSLIHTTNATILSGDLLNDDDAVVDFNDTSRDDNSKHVVEVIVNNLEINGLIIQDGYADALSGDDRFGGGVYKSVSVTNLSIRNCVIKNNTAYLGAGLSLSSTSTSNIIIDACVIDGNLANTAAGLDFHMSANAQDLSISITNSLFSNNKTDDDTVKNRLGYGAAAARLRAYFPGVVLNATLVNNTFANNSSLGVTNGTATGNFPVIAISKNSGSFGNLTVANNIFWGNIRINGQSAPAIGKSSNTSTAFNELSSTAIVIDNTEENGFTTFTSTPAGTVTTDPLFTSSTDFTLQPSSSAIDTGNNSYGTSATDLFGNQRVINSIVDRGAYEYDSSTLGTNDFSLSDNQIKLYPNPANSQLNIKMNVLLKNATILNIQGQKVIESNSAQIDVSSLSNGMYIISIEDQNGFVSTKRFVKN